ncbi:MAG TPA: chalcone isomerase family protein [Thermoanaerobaculaceae bacterium]|nr:chalcone isomerase family protein [Thermoanaerobaculaceae bacterium]HRS14738.1 chalcone isomerase family protein [Thermoanaerobaculaceae bacterium]
MRVAGAFLLAATLAAGAGAAELAGVSLPDAVQAAGSTLKLNGAGVRKKVIVKVYVGGLYLVTPRTDPAAILAADEPRQMIMHFVYKEVEAAKVTEAFREGFAGNSAAALPALQARLDAFCALWPAMRSGDRAVMTYVPGDGTTLAVNGTVLGKIEGKDFADALFAVWLGPKPADASLKAGLLGKS